MAAITICSDFGAQKKKSLTLFPLFPHLFPMKWWDQMPWSSFSECWALGQLFSPSSFTFIRRLLSSSSLSAISVVSSAYLRCTEMQQIFMYWSCILPHWWIHVLVLIVFVWILYDSLHRIHCYLQIATDLTSFFLIWITFISFCFVIAVTRATNTIWIKVVRVGILVLFQGPNECLSHCRQIVYCMSYQGSLVYFCSISCSFPFFTAYLVYLGPLSFLPG